MAGLAVLIMVELQLETISVAIAAVYGGQAGIALWADSHRKIAFSIDADVAADILLVNGAFQHLCPLPFVCRNIHRHDRKRVKQAEILRSAGGLDDAQRLRPKCKYPSK